MVRNNLLIPTSAQADKYKKNHAYQDGSRDARAVFFVSAHDLTAYETKQYLYRCGGADADSVRAVDCCRRTDIAALFMPDVPADLVRVRRRSDQSC